jgi:hypothetical protein
MIVPVPWVFVLTYLVGAGLEWARPRAVAPHAARASTIVGAALFLAGAAIAGDSNDTKDTKETKDTKNISSCPS